MIKGLHAANNVLSASLDQGLVAFSAFANSYSSRNSRGGIPRVVLGNADNELQLITSYDMNIKQARAIASQTKPTTTPTRVPIHVLPPEILIVIFQLVLDAQPCYFEHRDQRYLKGYPLKYPEILSHVCSRWRQIALSSHMLWSHIDLVPFNTCGSLPSKRLLARAKVFASRADCSMLSIHLAGQTNSDDPDSPDIDLDLDDFCASVATGIKSLELSTYQSFRKLHLSVLQHCFTEGALGLLNQLTIASNTGILTSGSLPYTGTTGNPFIELDPQCYEECLLPVETLRLTGVYFPWTHQVYHGLVELHLIPQNGLLGPPLPITKPHLLAILGSSPKLRILHLGLDIVDPTPHADPCITARLRDLEVLNLRSMSCDSYQVLLQLLSLGSKPLQLSLSFHFNKLSSILFSDEFKTFFTRSNVTQLYIEGNSSLCLLKLLGTLHMPGLQSLVLADCELGPVSHPGPASNTGEHDCPTCTRLDTLHLIYCTINLNELRHIAAIVPIRTLKLGACSVQSDDNSDIQPQAEDKKNQLAEISPVVEFFSAPDVLKDWNPWY